MTRWMARWRGPAVIVNEVSLYFGVIAQVKVDFGIYELVSIKKKTHRFEWLIKLFFLELIVI